MWLVVLLHCTACPAVCSPARGLPESRLKFLSGVAGGAGAVVLPLAVIADPALEKFTKGEARTCGVRWHSSTACDTPIDGSLR